jgi:Protein of unknown function (DUF2474)
MPRLKRLGWFVAIWAISVGVLAIASTALRYWLA